MVMKKLIKESFVSIIRTKKRFISILLIVLLGVGFFAGIKATPPDMKDTMNKYYKDTNFMDFNLKSTWGITDEDILSFENIGYNVEVGYGIDAIIEADTEKVAHILSYNENNDINKIVLLDGMLPRQDNECVVEITDESNIKLGDTIKVLSENIVEKELKVVGFIKSPIYSSIEKGSTTLLSGTINLYMYVRESNFNVDYYTDMYIKLNNNYHTFSDDYKSLISKEKAKLEELSTSLGKSRYQELLNDSNLKIENAKNEYEKYFNSISSILNNPNISFSVKEELKNKLAELEEEIINAESELASLEEPSWYVLDRENNVGFYQFSQDVDRIDNVAKLFPLVFFIVAILICLTAMTRMVEEERTQLGTLKSLGYNNWQIVLKYVNYAFLATVIGSLVGVCIGFVVIPTIIFNMYALMYSIGDIVLSFNVNYAVLGTVIAVICTVGATLFTCYKELREVPSQLMRPKSPKIGKKVFLECFPFIWKRINFTNKVTIRNSFRYKKRFLMTIIGITGCTGLILAGFGLRDCIINMVPNQYSNIFNYQLSINLDSSLSREELDSIVKEINLLEEVSSYSRIYEETISLPDYDTNQTIQLIVPFDSLDGFIEVRDRVSGKDIEIIDGVVVSEKLFNLLEMKKGDFLSIEGKGNYTAEILATTENYIFHYMYMDKSLLKNDKYNSILIKTDSMSEDEEKNLSKKLQEIEGISSVKFLSAKMHTFDDTMSSFGLVALVLIVSAGLLAFVVLYNLATVNISERKRELATIKVLGFYDNEVYNYVSRETSILTFIGILLGLVFGVVLTKFIIKTCELDMMFFAIDIEIVSYIYAIIITVVFTFLVNIMVYFSLKKINMIESLKSVE